MKETNLTSSPRLKGRCCLTDFLYSKATLLLLIFLLPLVGMAQEQLLPAEKAQKEAELQTYLDSKYGNKSNALLQEESLKASNEQMTQAAKLEKAQALEKENLRAKLENAGIEVQKLLDSGITLQQILENVDDKSKSFSNTILNRATACADAELLSCDSPIVADTYGITTNTGPGGTCGSGFTAGYGVWYTFTGNGFPNTITASNWSGTTGFTPQIRVYNGTCGSLSCITPSGGTQQSGTSVEFLAPYGDSFYVFVSGFSNSLGAFTITRTSTGDCIDGPSGDGLTSESAYEISCGNTYNEFSTVGVTATEVPQDCTGGGFNGPQSNGIWFTFTAVEGTPEDISVSLCGTGFDTQAYVYAGTPGNYTCVAADDDAGFPDYECGSYTTASYVSFTAAIDVQYFVYICGYSSSYTGDLQLELICSGTGVTPPPSAPNNDLCPDAITLICGDVVEGTNIAATTTDQPSTGDCSGSISSNSPGVWYRFEGEGSTVTVETCGFDTELFVYTGSCGAFTCVGDNDGYSSTVPCNILGGSTVTFEALDGNDYYFYVVGWGGETGDFEISVACEGPLQNDDCADALVANCGDIITGSTVAASASNPPYCDYTLSGPGVWYRHTGTGELLTVDLSGSLYDTRLAIYTGDCNGGLVCVDGDDDSGTGLDSLINLSTIDGEEYYIYVTGFLSATGTFTMELTCQADPCEEATPITCGEVVTGTTLGGSTAGPTSYCGTSPGTTGVYYVYEGTDEFVTASLCNSSYDTKINIYEGSCGDFNCVTGNDDSYSSCGGSRSEASFFGSSGSTYYIWVSGYGTSTGDYELELTCTPPPANDLCQDAIALSCGASVSGTTDTATDRDKPEDGCPGFVANGTGGVWYTIVGTGGEMNLSLCDSDFDTVLRVYTGECGGELTCYAGDDDAGSPGYECGGSYSSRSFVNMETTAGEVYYIYVTGYSSNTGNYTLDVDCLCYAPDTIECVTVYDGYDDPSYSQATLTGELQEGEAPISYLWSNGDTTQSTTVYAADGSQNYTVTMTDASGCTGIQEFFVYAMDVNCDTRGTDKVEICHNGTTICVAPTAVDAHLQHGDVLGACGNGLCDEITPVCDLTITSPINGETGVSTYPTIQWTEASGLVDGYTISIVDANGVEVLSADAGLSTSYGVGLELEGNSDYTVSVSPYNSNGSTPCAASAFTTAAPVVADGLSCDTGFIVSCGSVMTGSTVGYPTHNPGYCGTSTSSSSPGVWFKLIGDGSNVNASLCNSSYDTKINVYEGNCSGLICVVGDDDNGTNGVSCSSSYTTRSIVPFNTTAGTTYYIYVHGYSSNAGDYELEITCSSARSTGGDVTSIKDKDWSMSPNPTKGNVTLDLSNYLQSDVTVDVMNINGQVIFNTSLKNLKGSNHEVELNNNLPAGMYFVRVAVNNQVLSTKKLMIMR